MLYIIKPEKYKNYLEKGNYKYIFPLFTPMFKTKILEDIIIEDELKGKVVGVNLKSIDYKDTNSIKRFISNINKLKDENNKNIYIEGIEKWPFDIKKRIEDETDLIFPDELDLKLYNIKLILEEISKTRSFLVEEEVLIICKDKELVSKIIGLIYEKFSFISILPDIEGGETICEEVLNDTGLSVFIINDIDRSIKNYGIIINVEKDLHIDGKKVKRNSIVFDFSDKHEFRNVRDCVLIEDIIIKDIGDTTTSLLSREFTSSLYENLTKDNRVRFNKVDSRGKLCFLHEMGKCRESLKGNI